MTLTDRFTTLSPAIWRMALDLYAKVYGTPTISLKAYSRASIMTWSTLGRNVLDLKEITVQDEVFVERALEETTRAKVRPRPGQRYNHDPYQQWGDEHRHEELQRIAVCMDQL